jgi:hypothetical protein
MDQSAQPPTPLTAAEQEALKTCEDEIRASLEKHGCDIQGVAQIATGNVVVNSVIVKVRTPETAPAASGAAAAAGAPANAPAGATPAVPATPAG